MPVSDMYTLTLEREIDFNLFPFTHSLARSLQRLARSPALIRFFFSFKHYNQSCSRVARLLNSHVNLTKYEADSIRLDSTRPF